jgi:hypothetical protein
MLSAWPSQVGQSIQNKNKNIKDPGFVPETFKNNVGEHKNVLIFYIVVKQPDSVECMKLNV